MISKRTLDNWRIDSLRDINKLKYLPQEGQSIDTHHCIEMNERILRLTQDLRDFLLVQKT